MCPTLLSSAIRKSDRQVSEKVSEGFDVRDCFLDILIFLRFVQVYFFFKLLISDVLLEFPIYNKINK